MSLFPVSVPSRRRRFRFLRRLAVALGCAGALTLSAGCARGENLLARDQEREAAENSAVVTPTEPDATTRPADLEAAPLITLTIDDKRFTPSALTVKPGLYRFRVFNRDEAPTYFWLRRLDGSEEGETAALITVANDARNDAYVTLVAGDYLFSAPMPPTAETFRLTVR